MHFIVNGIHLNPIDSWILVFLEHGAGWVSAFVALIVLIKTWRPVKSLYHSYILERLDTVEEEIQKLQKTTIASGSAVPAKAKRKNYRHYFDMFGRLKEHPKYIKKKIRPMSDSMINIKDKKIQHIIQMMDNI